MAEVERLCVDCELNVKKQLQPLPGRRDASLERPGQRRAKPRQRRTLKLLIWGGGLVLPMYFQAAQRSFATWNMKPDISVLPLPREEEFEWPKGTTDRAAIFRRISVAYGLSFDYPTLTQHRFPDEIEPLAEDDEPPLERPQAPSKDEVWQATAILRKRRNVKLRQAP